jgi:hypothetical protein
MKKKLKKVKKAKVSSEVTATMHVNIPDLEKMNRMSERINELNVKNNSLEMEASELKEQLQGARQSLGFFVEQLGRFTDVKISVQPLKQASQW